MGRIRHHSAPRGGLTLIELLLVMGIAAIVGALTVLSFAGMGRRASREGAAQRVTNMLRRAQVSAVDSGRGAFVRINAAENALYGLASSVEAAWHFEEAVDTDGDGDPDWTPGAKRMDGTLQNMSADPVVDGAVALCLEFDRSLSQYVNCGRYPIYDQTDGIRIEAWVRPEGRHADGDLFGIMGKMQGPPNPAGYGMGLQYNNLADDDYTVQAGLVLHSGGTPTRVQLKSAWTILNEEWSHVAVEFDGYEARLFVNGVLADLDSYRDDEDNPTPPLTPNPVEDPNPGPAGTDTSFREGDYIEPARTAALEIGRAPRPGGPPNYFEGRIDEPRLLSVASGSPVRLPDGVQIVTSDPVVHFDAQGRLDIAYHSGPIFVAVGDPYQAAEVAVFLPAGSSGPLTLRPDNPMPATGGLVMVGGELVRYADAVGLQLDNFDDPTSGLHQAGERVLFARMVEVTPTGVVRRVE